MKRVALLACAVTLVLPGAAFAKDFASTALNIVPSGEWGDDDDDVLKDGKQDIFRYIRDCKELGCTQLDPWNAHLADLKSYLEADRRLLDLYSDQDAWARKTILNVASSGKFSTDRTIAEYAAEIWNVKPCPVP